MTDINNLRERVEAAEERFGLLDEQQRHYSERVIGLIEAIEAQLAAARGEIEKQIDENLQLGQDLAAARSEIEQQVDANLRLSQENEELRAMLHSVLRSIEQKTHMKALQDLEARVSALVAGAGTVAAVSAPSAKATDDGDLAGDTAIEAAVEVPVTADAVVEADEAGSAEDDAAVIVEVTDDGSAGDGVADDSVAERKMTADEPEEDLGGAVSGEAESVEEAAEPAAEADDQFAAMAELNASDEAFAEAIAEEAVPAEADAEGSAVEEPAADEWPDEAAAQVPDETADEIIEAAPDDVAAVADDGAAPTVKEIIRRVGDLARELERAEAARRAARGGGETDSDSPEAEAAFPPLHQAASG